MYIRPANLNDLDFMTKINLAAFQNAPQWNYRFQKNYKEFPEDYYRAAKAMLKPFLDDPKNYIVMLACSKTIEDPKVVQPVAHSVWRVVNFHDQTNSEQPQIPPTISQQEDRVINTEHVKAWRKVLDQTTKEYFDTLYGRKKIHLVWLATHPHYPNRGAATKLVRWGLEMANEHEMAVTLYSAQPTVRFYQLLGFKVLTKVTARVEGEEEGNETNAMVCEFKAAE